MTYSVKQPRTNRKKLSRRATARRHYLEALEPRQLMSAAPPVQTFYLPFPATTVLQALQTIHTDPQGPISTFTSIAVAEDNTQIFYDQWENGFAADIANPTASEIYNSSTNPAGVQIWGDGDPSNGVAPGHPSDVLHGGDVLLLESPAITIPRDPNQIYFDGGDKISVTKSVAIGTLNYASVTLTKFAGALQVNATSDWGTNYKVPIGQNTTGAAPMFDYTGLEIMAAKDGTTVQIDTDGNGTIDKTITLNQGENYLVNNGVKQGATVVSTDSTKPIQVDIITGTPTQGYASRWFNLEPVDQWSTSYYTPVSTRSSNATVIFLYNPSSTAITVNKVVRGSSGTAATLTNSTVSVPAKGTVKVTLAAGSGAHFYTAGKPFYAVSTTDVGSFNYDWGMALIPENQLTTQAIVGLGYGRDPTSSINPTENGSPVWVTPVGNGNTPETIYVDYNGDNVGALTDPNGFHYDVALSLKELQQAKVFDPDGNQSGMLLYTLNSNVRLAVSWGEDPATATASFPGIDAGTNVVPLPEFDAGKSASLLVDANNDGVVSPGDTLLYTIVVNNISRTPLVDLNVMDNLPSNLTYVANTAFYTITPHAGTPGSPVVLPDTGLTLFPMDEAGDTVPTLAGGATYTVTFQAKIADVLAAGVNDIINTGVVSSPTLHETVPIQSDTPVKYDVGGLVFQDINRDGAKQAGEPGLPNVTVNLLSGATIIATTTTDGTGHYLFTAIPNGTYTVDIDDNSVLLALPQSEQTAGIDPSSVIVNGGGAITDAGIDGYMIKISAIPSTIGGRVTVGGVGVSGVAITLTGSNAQGAIAPLTLFTAADGSYNFTGVMTGTYTLSETQPAGLLDGADFAGTFGGTVAPIPGDQISGIALPGAANGINYNFTEISPSTVTGSVYADANNDGIKQGGESPIGGAIMTLTGTDDLGVISPIIVTTAADGSYTFGNLRPGTYTVTETQPAGYLDGLDAKDGTVIPGSKTTDAVGGIILTSGGSSNVIFGDLLPASTTGFVYVDSNDNGAKDGGEAPIAGVQLTLTGSNDLGVITPITLTTAADGSYTFGNLRPGTYTVTETQPAGYFDGLDARNGTVIPASNTTDVVGGVSLMPGGSANIIFGELLPGSINGSVYVDSNNNGVKDIAEAPVGGVLLTLTGTSDLGVITPVTVTSAADGTYTFGNLRPGTYTITETQPAGYLDGLDAKAGAPIANSNTTDSINGIVVNSNSGTGGNNFGELLAGTTSGTAYVDANNNGIFDAGETPISGVQLTLSGTNDLGAITPVTVTSAADGTYSFGNLRPGTYTITETQPAGYLDGKDAKNGVVIPVSSITDAITGITTTSGSSSANNTFGELLAGTVSGTVYVDANNNGINDAGETPISGVLLTLTGTNDLGTIAPITVTSAADGSYSFGNLRPGSYTITETQPVGYLDGLDAKNGVVIGISNSTDTIAGITTTSGSNAANNTFGELLPANASGSVFVDANNNGTKDAGESPISGVQLTLTGTNDFGVITPITVTTAADGSYSFGNLRPGTYTITETQPAGYLDGLDAKAGVVIANSNSSDAISGITTASGSSAASNTFGELLAGTASGTVYVDANNNGIPDAGETPISGVQLTITGTNDLGMITPITVTSAADGSYSFGNLRPGTYTIIETQPAGYFDGKDAKNGVVIANSNSTDVITGITTTSGSTSPANTFGEMLAAGVSGSVYADANNNGIKDAGETPISGVQLTLTGTNDLGVIAPITVSSAADGSYNFGAIRPGTYTVTEAQPAGYLDGLDAKAGIVIANSNTTDAIAGIALNSGSSAANNTFGELLAGTASGSVYVDANNNGTKDAGEAPISGVQLTLTGTNDFGAITPVTITSAADGTYSFGNLRPGTYTITETQPAGYLDGLDAKAGVVITNSNTTDAIAGIALNSGSSAANNTFGELLAGTASGSVYVDANNNGTKDAGEAPISGVQLTLTGTNDFGAITPVTITSAADGTYSFGNLRPGTYTITETQPAGYLDGLDAKAGVVITNSNTTDAITGITTSSGSSAANNTFGELLPTAKTSGYVYVDTNNNGIKDAGEAPIAGVLLTLTGANDLGVITPITVTTAADGSYSFGNLRPGTYTITETQPAGYLDGLDAKAGTVISASNTSDTISGIIISGGNNVANNTFGELLPARLSGSVFSTTTRNCTTVNTPIAGVLLTLTGTNDLGAITAITTTTAADGTYSFGSLRPGTYTITETQPAGYNDGKDFVGSLGGTLGNDVISAIKVTSAAVGTGYNFSETPACPPPSLGRGDTATIGFWHNNNGQALIKSLNGSSTSTRLGNWLATTFPNIYGVNAGSMNLAGKTNAQIAAIYLNVFANGGSPKVDAQVFAVALASYSTSTTLAGGNYAGKYGFNVSSGGTGSHLFNVGSSGAAVGVPNNTSMVILDMLKYVNTQAVAGVLYNGNTALRDLANTLFTAINESGDII